MAKTYVNCIQLAKHSRKWVFHSSEKKTRCQDGHALYTHYIHNLNMAPTSLPHLCDVIYVYYKVALPEVENPEEVERSVRAYVLLVQQQQAFND